MSQMIDLGSVAFVWRGVWSGAVSDYGRNNVVRYNDNLYIALEDEMPEGEEPGSGATWEIFLTGNVTALFGDMRLLPFRSSTLPFGWYFCNGDRYALDTLQGRALAILPETFREDWAILEDEEEGTINLPDMFSTDGRGYFIRAAGGGIGEVTDDGMRKITGRIHSVYGAGGYLDGAFYFSSPVSTNITGGNGTWKAGTFGLDSSRLGDHFDAMETVPIHIGMTPAMYLGV